MKIEIPETLEAQRTMITRLEKEVESISQEHNTLIDQNRELYEKAYRLERIIQRLRNQLSDPPVMMTENAKKEFDKYLAKFKSMNFWLRLRYLLTGKWK